MHIAQILERHKAARWGASRPHWFSSCTSDAAGGATTLSPLCCELEGVDLASVEKEQTQFRERSAWRRAHVARGTDREADKQHSWGTAGYPEH